MTKRTIAAILMAALLASCSSGSTGPVAGELNVQLGSPGSEDGALLLTVSGGPVVAVEGGTGAAYIAPIDPNTTRIVIVGHLSSGLIARIRIADLSLAPHYSVTIDQVAVRPGYAPREPSQYAIGWAP